MCLYICVFTIEELTSTFYTEFLEWICVRLTTIITFMRIPL